MSADQWLEPLKQLDNALHVAIVGFGTVFMLASLYIQRISSASQTQRTRLKMAAVSLVAELCGAVSLVGVAGFFASTQINSGKAETLIEHAVRSQALLASAKEFNTTYCKSGPHSLARMEVCTATLSMEHHGNVADAWTLDIPLHRWQIDSSNNSLKQQTPFEHLKHSIEQYRIADTKLRFNEYRSIHNLFENHTALAYATLVLACIATGTKVARAYVECINSSAEKSILRMSVADLKPALSTASNYLQRRLFWQLSSKNHPSRASGQSNTSASRSGDMPNSADR